MVYQYKTALSSKVNANKSRKRMNRNLVIENQTNEMLIVTLAICAQSLEYLSINFLVKISTYKDFVNLKRLLQKAVFANSFVILICLQFYGTASPVSCKIPDPSFQPN